MPAGYDQYMASLLEGSPAPLQSSRHFAASASQPAVAAVPTHPKAKAEYKNPAPGTHPTTTTTSSLQEIEQALLNALARRLNAPVAPLEALYPGVGAGTVSHASLRGYTPVAHPASLVPLTARSAPGAEAQDHKDKEAPFKKRQRLTFEKLDVNHESKKSNEEEETVRAPSPTTSDANASSAATASASTENSSTAHSSNEHGFDKDLHAKLLTPRYHPAPLSLFPLVAARNLASAAAASAMGDLAFFDSLTHSLGASGLGRLIVSSSAEQTAQQQALLGSSTRVGHHHPLTMTHHQPSFNYSPPVPANESTFAPS